jgi:hypothetical protein
MRRDSQNKQKNLGVSLFEKNLSCNTISRQINLDGQNRKKYKERVFAISIPNQFVTNGYSFRQFEG